MTPTRSQDTAPDGLLRRTLRRRWRAILATWLVGTLAAGVYLKSRPSYYAGSILRVTPPGTKLYGIPDPGDQLDTFIKTQVRLITSTNILTAAGSNPKAVVLPSIQAASDVAIELRKRLVVTAHPGTYLIEVGMNSPSAYESATLVNAVVDAFMGSNNEYYSAVTKHQIDKLETYLGDLRRQSEELEQRWKVLASKGDVDAQVFVRDKTPDGAIKNEYVGAKRSSITLEQYKRLQKDLFDMTIELAQAEAWASALRADAAGGRDGEGRPVTREAQADHQQGDRELREAEARARKMKIRQAALKSEFDKLELNNRRGATDEVEIALVRGRHERLMAMQEPVVRRLEQLKFEARGEARITMVGPAVPPGRPTPYAGPVLMAAVPLGLLPIAFAVLACVEAFAGRPSGPPSGPEREGAETEL